jgi:hypothetical protein
MFILFVCKFLFIPNIAVPIRFLDSLKKVCAFILYNRTGGVMVSMLA